MKVTEYVKPEGFRVPIWVDDWGSFAQIFGTMMDLPKGFPMHCWDLKQLADMLGMKNEEGGLSAKAGGGAQCAP